MDPKLEKEFPKLKETGYELDSPPTPAYNCIAWAAGKSNRPWWPDKLKVGYWPIPERNESVDCFVAAFKTLGYAECESSDLEPGYEKVAIYAIGNTVKHMARQKEAGNWTSKCGKYKDITHALEGLVNAQYGKPVKFLKRSALLADLPIATR